MAVKLELSIAAEADLQNLFDYGFDRFGEAAALSYSEGLLEHFTTLTEFPEVYAEDKSPSRPVAWRLTIGMSFYMLLMVKRFLLVVSATIPRTGEKRRPASNFGFKAPAPSLLLFGFCRLRCPRRRARLS